jgi:hypothetical protein
VYGAADSTFILNRILNGFGSGEAMVDAINDEDDKRLLVVEPEWSRLLSVSRAYESAEVLAAQVNRAETDLTRASTADLEGAIAARFA